MAAAFQCLRFMAPDSSSRVSAGPAGQLVTIFGVAVMEARRSSFDHPGCVVSDRAAGAAPRQSSALGRGYDVLGFGRVSVPGSG